MSLAFEHVLLSMLPVAVVVIDGEGQVQNANPQAHSLLNCVLVGRLWRDIVHQVFKPQANDGCEVSLADGKMVSITTQALTDEPGQIIVLSDLTETRQMQEQVAKDRQLKEMGKMVASLAHQVRTPLSAALIYASTISHKDINRDQVQHFAKKLKVRLQNIEQQIKDMLLCAKGGNLVLSVKSLTEFLLELQEACIDRVQVANVKLAIFNYCGDVKIKCHNDTLLGAFCNIINNAIESGSDDLQITITAKLHQHSVLIAIEDNGSGMDQETLDQVTEPFFTTRRNGTGLGLDIVRAVIDEHDGRFVIASTIGVGTKITMTIPEYRVTNVNDKSMHGKMTAIPSSRGLIPSGHNAAGSSR